jgi:hypothetical protein
MRVAQNRDSFLTYMIAKAWAERRQAADAARTNERKDGK